MDKFYVGQKAAFCPGGAETIVHRFREVLESGGISNVEVIDLKNAFNTLSRKYLGEAIMELDPQMFAYVQWAYGDVTPILMTMEDGTTQALNGGDTSGRWAGSEADGRHDALCLAGVN